ncbi:MAG TPA: hypothetical protein VIM86_11915 [Thermodesulfobacteriota bacterium]
MSPTNGAARHPAGPDDLPLFERDLAQRLASQGAHGVRAEVSWMAKPVAAFKVTLHEDDRQETFGVPVRVLAADRDGRTFDRIVADALRRLRGRAGH